MPNSPLPLGPPLRPGDAYVYAHGNSALSVMRHDGRIDVMPMADVESAVRVCDAAGGQVVVGGDDAPAAIDALLSLGRLGVPLEAFGATQPPLVWPEGTDALMRAVAVGSDAILDDLLARGADVHHHDDTGATALHHAAMHGNVHAVDALVVAGADPCDTGHQNSTPLALAQSHHQRAAAKRLRAIGRMPAR